MDLPKSTGHLPRVGRRGGRVDHACVHAACGDLSRFNCPPVPLMYNAWHLDHCGPLCAIARRSGRPR